MTHTFVNNYKASLAFVTSDEPRILTKQVLLLNGKVEKRAAAQMTHDPADQLLPRLDDVISTSRSGHWLARCPACCHARRKLSISQLADKKLLIHCWRGCDPHDILAAIELQMRDLYPFSGDWLPRGQRDRERQPVDWHAMFSMARAEVLVALLVAGDVLNGQTPNDDDLARLQTAYDRLRAALEVHDHA